MKIADLYNAVKKYLNPAQQSPRLSESTEAMWNKRLADIDALRASLARKLAADPSCTILVKLACESTALRGEPGTVEEGTRKLNTIIERYTPLDNSRLFPANMMRVMDAMRKGHVGDAKAWRQRPPSEDAVHALLVWLSTEDEACAAMPADELHTAVGAYFA